MSTETKYKKKKRFEVVKLLFSIGNVKKRENNLWKDFLSQIIFLLNKHCVT